MIRVFISGNVPSLKNSKQWTGKFLTSSKTVKNYLREKGIKNYSVSKKCVENYKIIPNTFFREVEKLKPVIEKMSKPAKIELYFVRKDYRKFDYINVGQIIFDLLTAHGIIEDDNCDEVIPVFTGYEVNKYNPGVYITIEC